MTRWLWALSAAAAFGLGALSWIALRPWSGAVHVLVDLSGPAGVRRPEPSPRSAEVWLPEPSPVRARVYEPPYPVHRCIVVGHGVHHLGIEEPRLTRFARELAGTGVCVLTPELADIADYRITRAGADVLGAAARYLSGQCPDARVGLIGFSFAGGLALLAAIDPRNHASLAYVASVGGYHDLGRVLRFLLTDTVETPDGPRHRTAHEYGAVVLLYGHLERFVAPVDLPVARRAVRAWLDQDRPGAWVAASERVEPETEELFLQLAGGHLEAIRRRLGEILAESRVETDALSPRGHLAEIPVPVYLLHGSGDDVIPPEETLWAERELGSRPQLALVTPLLEHVEMKGTPRLLDEVALVRFMAGLL